MCIKGIGMGGLFSMNGSKYNSVGKGKGGGVRERSVLKLALL